MATTDGLGIPGFLVRQPKATTKPAKKVRRTADDFVRDMRARKAADAATAVVDAVDAVADQTCGSVGAVRDQHGLCQHNPSDDETVQLGRDAMARQRRGFDDWLLVAAALDVGQAEVMRSVHTNQPRGRRYEQAMAEWLVANGFKGIDKGARSRLLECLRHRDEVERWRQGLTEGERLKFNHPQTVLRRWRKTIAATAPNPEPKPSPVAKLKQTIVALEEDNHRMRRELERGGGDLWSTDDTNHDIARVMLTKLGPSRWKGVVAEGAKLMKAGKS